MNPLKCVFGISIEKFLCFIIHEMSIEIYWNVQAPTCKRELQSLLKQVNYLRQFISKLSEKINAFTSILGLKNEAEFT